MAGHGVRAASNIERSSRRSVWSKTFVLAAGHVVKHAVLRQDDQPVCQHANHRQDKDGGEDLRSFRRAGRQDDQITDARIAARELTHRDADDGESSADSRPANRGGMDAGA